MRKRLRHGSLQVSSGGGTGTPGLATWGPDFGNPPEIKVGVHSFLGPIELIANKTLGVHAQIGQVDIESLAASSGVNAELARYDLVPYLDWASANVTTTAITNPGNAIDKDTATFAFAQAASTASPTWLNNTTVNLELVSSFPDFVAPFTSFTIDSVFWEYAVQSIHTSAGAVVTAATCSVQVQRSINDGGSYATEETVSVINSGLLTRSLDITAVIAGSWTNVNQFRTRQVGTITSGVETAVQSIQQFRIFYNRLSITAHLDNP